jgi:hypothetical protein
MRKPGITDDRLLVFLAALMIETQGEQAWIETVSLADMRRAKGDLRGWELWTSVLTKIEGLQAGAAALQQASRSAQPAVH